MKRKLITASVACAVLLVVVVILAYTNTRPEATNESEPLIDTAVYSFTNIVYGTESHVVQLNKADGIWSFPQYPNASCDQLKIEQLIRDIGGMCGFESNKAIRYQSFSYLVITQDNNSKVRFEFYADPEVDDTVYVLNCTEDKVYAFDNTASLSFLQNDITYYVSVKLPALASFNIQLFQLTAQDAILSFSLADNSQWLVSSNSNAVDISQQTIEDIMTAAFTIYFDACYMLNADENTLEECGLLSPSLIIDADYLSTEKVSSHISIEIGFKGPNGYYYARIPNTNDIYLFSYYLYGKFMLAFS